MRTSSRLSKTLQEILHDRNAVVCFLEFLESRKAGHLLKFWLDAESFQASSILRMRSRSLRGKSSKKSPTESPTTAISDICAIEEKNENTISDRNGSDSSFPDQDSLAAEFEKENRFTLSQQSSADSHMVDAHKTRTSSNNSLESSNPAGVTDLGDEHKKRTSSSSSLENSNQHKECGNTESESMSDNTETNTEKKVRPQLSEEELQQKLRKSKILA